MCKRYVFSLVFLTLFTFCFAIADSPWDGVAYQEPPAPVWEAAYTKIAPTIDGQIEEVWRQAKPLTVFVREAMGGDYPKPVILRALYTEDTFYVLAQWPDATRSDMRDPYIWNAEKKEYERPSRPDDQFALEFPMSGDFSISMLTVTREYAADVWHWKAGRGNPIGWADDKYHVISQKPIEGAKEYSIHSGQTMYIKRTRDAGTPSHKLKSKPAAYEGDVVDSFQQQEPAGSAADVRGKGMHDGKGWTLEMARKFNTGHSDDDAIILPNRDNSCAIAVLDDELYSEHSVSSLITLRFVGRGSPKFWNFDGDPTGKAATGFRIAETAGKGKLATWQVIKDATAPSQPNSFALTKTENRGSTFNLALAEETSLADVDISVKVKAISGREDQGGGPIWRAGDADNYYVARWNPLEDNFRVYFVKNGRRKQLSGAKVKASPDQWHTIRIVMVRQKIEAYFDGKRLITVEDGTFMEAGMIGLWTKADAATYFDDLSVKPLQWDIFTSEN